MSVGREWGDSWTPSSPHLYALTERQLIQVFQTFHEGWDYRVMMALAEGFGFRVVRTSASHHIMQHPSIPEMVNCKK